MNNIFSFKRTIKIIRKDMFSEYKNLLTGILASAGVMITISALFMLYQKFYGFNKTQAEYFHYTIYIILLFLGGFIVTSSMFKDLHDKSKNIYWLTLPGSTFEKVLSRFLLSSILFVLILTLLYPVFATLSELFNLLLFDIRHDYFNPFTKDVLKLIPYFLVTQSIFFAGASTFKKIPFIKTLLFLALYLIVSSLLLNILLRLFFRGYFDSIQNLDFNNMDLFNITGQSIESFSGFANNILTFSKILFWGFLAPFFYIYSFLRISEKEVRDGL